MHACDALDLPMLQREELDAFIDQLYKDIEKGEALKCPWAVTRGAACRTWWTFCCWRLLRIQGLGGIPARGSLPLSMITTPAAFGLLCG